MEDSFSEKDILRQNFLGLRLSAGFVEGFLSQGSEFRILNAVHCAGYVCVCVCGGEGGLTQPKVP